MKTTLALALTLFASVAQAEVHVISGNGKTSTIACAANDSVDVRGNSNTLTLTGTCAKVALSGNANKIDVAQVDELMVLGNENSVVWHKGRGDKAPKITNLGNKNSIAKAPTK